MSESVNKQPGSIEQPQDLFVTESRGRKILYVPNEILVKIGGRDWLTRVLFVEIFGGLPTWFEGYDTHYAVELPPYDQEKIDVFKRHIIEESKKV